MFVHNQTHPPKTPPEVFMEKYEGNLRHLETANSSRYVKNLTEQILGVLIYLEKIKLVHRDIKPEHILYKDRYNFFLTDFGSSNLKSPPVGSAYYSVREIFSPKEQTSKVDIFSFAVVLLEITKGFPKISGNPGDNPNWFREWPQALYDQARSSKPTRSLEPMLRQDATQRLSAEECLNEFHKLETPQSPQSPTRKVFKKLMPIGKGMYVVTGIYKATLVLSIYRAAIYSVVIVRL